MQTVRFSQGNYNQDTLDKIAEKGGRRVKETYITGDGMVVYLVENYPVSWGEKRLIVDSFEPYDLEGRIREINGDYKS